jgi:CubicO group peptidase (beta-lactamase class C family)
MLASMNSQGTFSGSVLISQHGHVLLSKGYGFADRAQKTPNGPRTRFAIGSITKQFTAAAVLLLEVQGKLKVGDLICKYIAQCPTAWADITIKELLTHTSGIPDYVTTLPDFAGYAGPPVTPLQIIAHFRDLPLEFTPGSTWKYSNSGYVLLGYIIEQVSGLSYEAFLQKNILTPLNLSDTGYNHNSDGVAKGYNLGGDSTPAQPMEPSIPYAAGALYSTVEDMNRWEQALTTDALLPAASRAEMFAPQVTLPPNMPSDSAGYGYGFFIGTDLSGRPIIWHGGTIPGFASTEARYPVEDVTVIVLDNQNDADLTTILGAISTSIFSVATAIPTTPDEAVSVGPNPPIGVINQTSLDEVAFYVNGDFAGNVLAGTRVSGVWPMPALPWHLELRSASGLSLLIMDVGGAADPTTGPGAKFTRDLTLSCGYLAIWYGAPPDQTSLAGQSASRNC